jgi:hypothetical protein
MRFHFLRIEGEHLLNASWPLQIANDLQCHIAHANWPLQTMIITNRTVYNAIQLVRRCASAINKKHATLCRKGHTKKGRVGWSSKPDLPWGTRGWQIWRSHNRHCRRSSGIIKCSTLLLLTGSNGSLDNRGGRRRAGQIQSYNNTSV